MDNVFDNIFDNIQPVGNKSKGNVSIEIMAVPREDDDSGFEVTGFKDITPEKKDTESESENKRVEANKSNESEVELLADQKLSSNDKPKEESEISKLASEAPKTIKIETPKKETTATANASTTASASLTDGSFSLGNLLKLLFYFSISIVGVVLLLFIFTKLTEREKEPEVKHTINDIEDELRGIKDKNKIF
jgi:hypothetical protein